MTSPTPPRSQTAGANHRFLRALLAFLVLGATLFISVAATPAQALAAPIDCSRGVNLSWEAPVLAQNWRGVPESEVAGWSSSSGVIEIWQSGFLGAIAPDGQQLSELQANDNSPSWQDIPTLPGDSIDWSFYHRGRENTDTVVVRMGSASSQDAQATFSTGTAAFVRYSGTYVVPAGQTTTRFMLDPQDTGSVGNLVDAVTLTVECSVSINSSVQSINDVDGSGDVNVGDEVAFAYEVANDGTASLLIMVSEDLGDAVSCPASPLTPGSSMTCTSTHIVVQADVDAGSVMSGAQATGTDASGLSVSDSDVLGVDIEQRPAVSLVKTGSVDPSVVAPDTRPDSGDVVTYGFDVANTGNVTLTSIAVVDALAPASCPDATLAPGASMRCAATYSIDQSDVDSGGVDNTATVTASPPSGDDVAAADSISTSLDLQPSLSVEKAAGSRTYTTPGDELEYSIVATNTGNATLFGVSVNDDTVDTASLTCDTVLPATLSPGDQISCVAVRTVTQSDIDVGTVSNTAYASGQDPVGQSVAAEDTATVTADQRSSITIDKVGVIDDTVVGPLDRTDSGDHIDYTITVTNTGNVTLSDYAVSDPSIDDLACDPSSVVPGKSFTCTGSDTIVQADIDDGEMSNTATATAKTPSGGSVEATTTITTAIDQQSDVTLSKTATATSHGDGSFSFVYAIEVLNPGNTTLTDVQIEDDLEAAFGELPFSIVTLKSDNLVVNSMYDGRSDVGLLSGSDQVSPGEPGRIELVVLVFTDGGSGPFRNVASVVAEGSVRVLAANSSVETSVDVAFDLSMAKTSALAVGPGGSNTWTLAVSNEGPSVAPGPITVVDVLDDELTFASASGPGWTCIHDDGTVTCVHNGDLVAGSVSTIAVVTLVDADPGATISNTATVVAANAANESTTANNADAATVRVDALPVTGIATTTLGLAAIIMFLLGMVLLGTEKALRRRGPD